MSQEPLIRNSIQQLREAYRSKITSPNEVINAALSRANKNAGANVYLARDEEWSRGEAARLIRDGIEHKPLWGVPISLKDCFDLQGFVSTCGSKMLRGKRSPAADDSAVAKRLRMAGAVVTGKTHMHQLAYGITGENRDFGDCLQPGAGHLLTGGSSSGAAASVLEGSAMAAVGTDTGGSIRIPAGLCGLAGYRSSITLGEELWHGGEHLAPSFDTIGWIYCDLKDGPLLGQALFGVAVVEGLAIAGLRFGVPDADFMHDCQPAVLRRLEQLTTELREMDAVVQRFDTKHWKDAAEIFVPIQASEAAALRPEPRDGFEEPITQRLRWGASLKHEEIEALRARMAAFRKRTEEELAKFDFLLVPNSPVLELRAGEDHSGVRSRILRYTTPVSIMGWPAVTLPGYGSPQIVGKLGSDAELLALSIAVGSAVSHP